MSRPTPRRTASSRGAVNRPRKIAGRDTSSAPGPLDDTPSRAHGAPVDVVVPEDEVVEVQQPEPEHEAAATGPEPDPVLASPAATRLLMRILTVLAVILVLQAVWWARHTWLVDEPKEPSKATGAISVPADRPIVENELAWKEGVDVAATAIQTMMTRSHETYDADVDKAAEYMTDDFAEEFRNTTDDVKQSFLSTEAVMGVDIRAQSVVRANDAELQALVFFDNTTVTTAGEEPKTVKSAYRALVTMVHTDKGWFVDRIDAS